MFESAKELTKEAAASASARLGEEAIARPRDVKRCLNSRLEKEKLNGMRAIMTVS